MEGRVKVSSRLASSATYAVCRVVMDMSLGNGV